MWQTVPTYKSSFFSYFEDVDNNVYEYDKNRTKKKKIRIMKTITKETFFSIGLPLNIFIFCCFFLMLNLWFVNPKTVVFMEFSQKTSISQKCQQFICERIPEFCFTFLHIYLFIFHRFIFFLFCILFFLVFICFFCSRYD